MSDSRLDTTPRDTRRRWKMPLGVMLAIAWMLLCLLAIIIYPPLSGLEPSTINLTARLSPPVGFGGTWAHPLGTDDLGRDVLARLVPLDLSPAACPKGSARRTLLGHMSCLILHPGGAAFEILVFRSMAHSAVHELTRAMTAVAARRARDGHSAP